MVAEAATSKTAVSPIITPQTQDGVQGQPRATLHPALLGRSRLISVTGHLSCLLFLFLSFHSRS